MLRSPLTATDVIVEYKDAQKEGIILIDRLNPPYGKALPGGFHEVEKKSEGNRTFYASSISLGENAQKEIKEETNLEVIIENEEEPFLVLSNPNRDPRGPVIAIVYIAQGNGKLKAGDDAKNADLYSIKEIMDMLNQNLFAFDHEYIITRYLQKEGYL